MNDYSDAPKRATTAYQRALLETIAIGRAQLCQRGEKPIAVKLMPEEWREVIRGVESTMTLFPGGPSQPMIMGMAIAEQYEPIPLADRFVMDRDS